MKEKPKRKAGRPIVDPREGEKATLGIRATAELKRQLQEAAKPKGASLSEEAVNRLNRSFAEELAFGGQKQRDMAYLMAGTFRHAGRAQAARIGRRDLVDGEAWMADRDSYEGAMRAVIVQLWLCYPGGFEVEDVNRVDLMVRSNLMGRRINTDPFEEGARS